MLPELMTSSVRFTHFTNINKAQTKADITEKALLTNHYLKSLNVQFLQNILKKENILLELIAHTGKKNKKNMKWWNKKHQCCCSSSGFSESFNPRKTSTIKKPTIFFINPFPASSYCGWQDPGFRLVTHLFVYKNSTSNFQSDWNSECLPDVSLSIPACFEENVWTVFAESGILTSIISKHSLYWWMEKMSADVFPVHVCPVIRYLIGILPNMKLFHWKIKNMY